MITLTATLILLEQWIVKVQNSQGRNKNLQFLKYSAKTSYNPQAH